MTDFGCLPPTIVNVESISAVLKANKNLSGISMVWTFSFWTIFRRSWPTAAKVPAMRGCRCRTGCLRLRRKGVAVLLIHHAGVNGRQRGTSRREDALDTVIALRRPADYSPEQGARFEVHIEKARTLVGEGPSPFEAAVEPFTTEGGKSAIRWTGP